MAKICRPDYRYSLKIDDVELIISPLTFEQKVDISSCTTNQGGQSMPDTPKLLRKYIKYSVKDANGIEYGDGKKYKVKLEESGVLTDECVEDIVSLSINTKLMSAAYQMLMSIPDELVDPETGKKMEGVSIEYRGSAPKKPKSR